LLGRGAIVAVQFAPQGARRGDLGADRRAHREKQRQRSERVEIVVTSRFGEVAVEHDIGGCIELALDQVHQQEGEIVEHIAGCDPRIELDGVEQSWFAVEQHDVAEVQVAVTATHQAVALARSE